jgi:hypothetical protein
LLAAPAAAAAQPAAEGRPRFDGLFVNWSAASRESIEAERKAAAQPAPAPVSAAAAVALATPGSQALGERVGEIVAMGDCAEGERVARTAGDFALVAAVREHCHPRSEAAR